MYYSSKLNSSRQTSFAMYSLSLGGWKSCYLVSRGHLGSLLSSAAKCEIYQISRGYFRFPTVQQILHFSELETLYCFPSPAALSLFVQSWGLHPFRTSLFWQMFLPPPPVLGKVKRLPAMQKIFHWPGLLGWLLTVLSFSSFWSKWKTRTTCVAAFYRFVERGVDWPILASGQVWNLSWAVFAMLTPLSLWGSKKLSYAGRCWEEKFPPTLEPKS